MGFLFPLFLIAGLTLLIPVLIHLFNLRRYKTVLFPHTRFLKNIQLQSQKQSQLRYKWLLAARLLFLALLVLSFSQPFWDKPGLQGTSGRIQVIYLDNSYSMSLKQGARTLLDIAKENAARQIAHSKGEFIILSNDKSPDYIPIPAAKALTTVEQLTFSPAPGNNMQVLLLIKSLQEQGMKNGADVYYYSDFQENSFHTPADPGLLQHITWTGIPIRSTTVQNLYIDTAWFNIPSLQTNTANQLIVRSRVSGKQPGQPAIVQLSVDGQVKSAATVSFNGKKESYDTLSLQVNNTGWHKITISLTDISVHFDDSFMIAARSTPSLAVLVVNEKQPNPYIQAAFHSYEGFRLTEVTAGNTMPDFSEYNLVVLNGFTGLDPAIAGKLNAALQQGKNVCIFPGSNASLQSLNEGISLLGDIRFTGTDTAGQTISSIQQGHPLVKDIFEHIPDNVQLPTANGHYKIQAGLSANEQTIMSFRNGDPFLASYALAKGQLYLSAVSADLQAGNFAGSYFFVPFLYQMAAQAKNGDINAITAGKKQAVYLHTATSERDIAHLYAENMDAIPPQRNDGMGLNVFPDYIITQPGFYVLTTGNSDSTYIGLNADRKESELRPWNIDMLRKQWRGDNIRWQMPGTTNDGINSYSTGTFPLWKVCTILALLMLAAETYLLTKNMLKKQVATT